MEKKSSQNLIRQAIKLHIRSGMSIHIRKASIEGLSAL